MKKTVKKKKKNAAGRFIVLLVLLLALAALLFLKFYTKQDSPAPAEPSDPEEIGKAADVINDFLSKQSRSSRVLFLQRYYLGKSIREAAKCAGMTESGAKTRLSRMRTKLKVKLEEEGILL